MTGIRMGLIFFLIVNGFNFDKWYTQKAPSFSLLLIVSILHNIWLIQMFNSGQRRLAERIQKRCTPDMEGITNPEATLLLDQRQTPQSSVSWRSFLFLYLGFRKFSHLVLIFVFQMAADDSYAPAYSNRRMNDDRLGGRDSGSYD